MESNEVTCWRCGVDFIHNSDQYKEGAPCPDCCEDVPEDYHKTKNGPGRLSAAASEQRAADVKRLHQAGLLDPEIAAQLGLSRSTISTWRKKLGLKAHYRPEKHMWKDVEAHIQHAATMVQSRGTHVKGRDAYGK